MPKVLQINSVLNTGSTGRIVEQIGLFVKSQGWESLVAYGRSVYQSSLTSIKTGNKWEQVFHVLQTRLLDRHGLGSKNATKKLLKEIDNISPDIIHLHNIHGYYLNYPLWFDYLSRIKIPVVWTLHDCWAFTGHCSHFSDINCMKWKTQCFDCPKTRNYPESYYADNSLNNYNLKKRYFNKVNNLHIVTVSQWLASIVSDSFLNKNPVRVIHNWIDPNEFFPSINQNNQLDLKYGFSGRKVLLGVATSWAKNKGWDDFMALSKQLTAEYVVVLVGVSNKQRTLLPPDIIGITRTESKKELAALYSRADVLLNLSYQETFGMTTIEAMACGTPVIAYNATASPELIVPGTGIVVDPGSIDQLQSAIKEIDGKGKNHYSNNCRNHIGTNFTISDNCDQYLQLYKKLIGVNQ